MHGDALRLRRLDTFDRYGLGLCLGLIALAAGALALVAAGWMLPQALFALLWLAFWTLALAILLIQPLRIAALGQWYRLAPLVLTVLLFLYAAVRLGATSFAIDDELTSWNYWAIQHFLGMPADFSYTQSAYPQLLAYWVGSIYRALGTDDLQSVARLTLALVTLMWGLLLMQASENGGRRGAWLAVLLMLLMWFGGLRLSFTRGLADPLMVLALLVSVHCFLEYAKYPHRIGLLISAAIAAVVAGYTKQPGLIWACFGMPLLTVWQVGRGRWKGWTLALALLVAVLCAIWPAWVGQGFQQNQGVITRSLGGRGLWLQLAHSTDLYLIRRPWMLVLLVGSFYVCWSRELLRGLWLCLLLPMLLAWFIWGAYAFRLGMHVIGLASLLLLHATCAADGKWGTSRVDAESPEHSWRFSGVVAATVVFLVVLGTGSGAVWVVVRHGVDLAHGSEMTIRHYFAGDAERVLAIKRSRQPVWVSSNYLNGMFYGSNRITRPRSGSGGYSREQLLAELSSSGAKYAFSAGIVPYGPASSVLIETTRACPRLFREVTQSRNTFNFHVFKINLAALGSGSCRS